MLDLLKEAGVAASGVDTDSDMVQHCRSKGHAVEQQDALQFLRDQPESSIAAIFTAQVIEHLTYGELKELLELCRSRLEPGGVLIAETVNPHALEAFKTFYTDLTHQRPIFPEVALTLAQLAGFEEAYVTFPLGTGELESDRRSQGEYAVIATAGRRRNSPSP
jgi:cyclopropane fatty-acyl-phospholipid synthase-like methyltransferase